MSRRFLYIILVFAYGLSMTVSMQAQVNPFDLKYKLTSSELAREAEIDPVENLDSDVADAIDSVDMLSDSDEAATPVDITPADEDKADTVLSDQNEDLSVDTTTDEVSTEEVKSEEALLEESITDNGTTIDDSVIPAKKQSRPLFLFLMLIAATILTTLTISSNKSVVNNILRAVLNDNYLNLIYREQKKLGAFHYYILYFVFVVNAGLFLYFLLSRMVFVPTTPLLWKCVLLIAVAYAIRHIFMSYLANVYPFKKELEQYSFTILIFNVFLGVVLLPINVFIAFSPPAISTFFLYAGLIFALIVYVFRQLRGVFIGSRLLFNNKFYFLLYLCAVEIAPVLLLVKYIGAYVS